MIAPIINKTTMILEAEAKRLELQAEAEAVRLRLIAEIEVERDRLEAEAKTAEAKAAQICASVGVEPAQVTPGGEPKQQSLVEQLRCPLDASRRTSGGS